MVMELVMENLEKCPGWRRKGRKVTKSSHWIWCWCWGRGQGGSRAGPGWGWGWGWWSRAERKNPSWCLRREQDRRAEAVKFRSVMGVNKNRVSVERAL